MAPVRCNRLLFSSVSIVFVGSMWFHWSADGLHIAAYTMSTMPWMGLVCTYHVKGGMLALTVVDGMLLAH